MSSLLSTASAWNNDTPSSKKRTPSIGLKKLTSAIQSPVSSSLFSDNTQSISNANADETNISAPSLSELTQYNQSRNARIHAVLENMNVDDNNVGEKLANFNPLPRPALMKGNGMYPSNTDAITTKPPNQKNADEAFTPLQNDYQVPPPQINMQRNYSGLSPMPKLSSISTGQPQNHSHTKTPSYSNYHTVFQSSDANQPPYTHPRMRNSPYYANAKTLVERGEINEKLLEKINYMIHLLEEQQLEKTNNVMEEFILYSLLGVFMIYVLDSFARAGKYVR